MSLRSRTLNTTLRTTPGRPWSLRFGHAGGYPPDWMGGHNCELVANARDWFGSRCLAAAVYRVPERAHVPDSPTRLRVVVAYGTVAKPEWLAGVVKEER
jgi:hypothetical protein